MTPSALRRQGREAFDPQVSEPLEICPYRDEFKTSCWMDGWYEGEKLYKNTPRKAFGVEIDTNPIDQSTMSDEEKRIHALIMSELDDEWDDNSEIHKMNRWKEWGIRSSQISALVALLIKKGILK